jgi:hypothetical protein
MECVVQQRGEAQQGGERNLQVIVLVFFQGKEKVEDRGSTITER